MAKGDKKTPKALRVVPTSPDAQPPTEEQQAIQALSQQLQATRTELAVLKQMYAEVSVQARIALSERDRLLQEVQRIQQVLQNIAAEKEDAAEAPAEPVATEEPEE